MLSKSFLTSLVCGLWALYGVVALWESPGSRGLIQWLVRQWLQRTLLEKLAIIVIVGLLTIYAGTKPPCPTHSHPHMLLRGRMTGWFQAVVSMSETRRCLRRAGF